MKFKQFTIPMGKIIHASFLGTIFRMLLQYTIPEAPEADLLHFFSPSWFNEHGLLIPVFFIYMMLFFISISVLTIRYASGTDDYPIGLIIFLLAIVWSIYLLEPLKQLQYGTFVTSGLVPTLKYLIVNFVALTFFGIGLHNLVRVLQWTKDIHLYKNEYSNADIKTSEDLVNEQLNEIRSFIPILYYYPVYLIPVLFLRLWVYPKGLILNDYAHRPVQSIVWIIIMTMTNFLIYTNLLRKYKSRLSNYFTPAFFLLLVNIIFFNIYILLIVKVPIMDSILRTSIDYLPLLLVNFLTNMRRIKI